MIYLASPYSHPDPLIMKSRFLVAEQVTAYLLQQRQFVYSPIVHCHEITQKYEMPTTFDFWQRYNFDMLRRADTFGILRIKGWDQSKGVEAEWRMARKLGIPTYFFNADGEVETDVEAA